MSPKGDNYLPFETSEVLIGQLYSIRVPPLAVVLVGKNFFEPARLPFGGSFVHKSGIVKNDKLLAASVTAKSPHFVEVGGPLSRLTLLDRHCLHAQTFYLSSPILLKTGMSASLMLRPG